MASLVVLKVLFTVPENIIRKECHDEAGSFYHRGRILESLYNLALVIYLKGHSAYTIPSCIIWGDRAIISAGVHHSGPFGSITCLSV